MAGTIADKLERLEQTKQELYEALLQKWLQSRDVADLEARLEQAIQQENYEFAKIYKEELSRRKQQEK